MRSWVHAPLTHLLWYCVLLLFLPPLLMKNHLAPAVSVMSREGIALGGVRIPFLLLAALVLLAGWLVLARRHITRVRVVAGLSIALMVDVSHRICDVYADLPFFDLRQNWHYGAFGLLTLLALRVFRRLPTERQILFSYLLVQGFYCFDEVAQIWIVSRVFDMNDVAKNGWGSLMALVFGLYVIHEGRTMGSSRLLHDRLSGYLGSPRAVLLQLLSFNFILLLVSSVLAEPRYWVLVLTLSFSLYLVTFVLLHLSRLRPFRIGLVACGVAAVLALGASWSRHRNDDIHHYSPEGLGLFVYKGIPVPFFDLVVYPDGTAKPINKKPSFNTDDRRYILNRRPDIAVVGTGHEGSGGLGLSRPGDNTSWLVFNPETGRPTQLMIMPNPEAVETFNRLKREGKARVLFVGHHAL